MTRISPLLTLVAVAALAGCNSENHTITAGPNASDSGNEAQVTKNVTLPPPIAATKLYRCSGDNSVVQVDWLADNKTANVRLGANASPTQVTTAEEGKPMTAPSGLSLTGKASGSSITVKLPAGGTKACHV